MIKSNSAIQPRRQFVKTVVVAIAAAVAGGAIRKLPAEEPHLTDADPTARAMDYTEDAATSKNTLYKPGSACANCQLYTGGAAGYGGCQLFPGKLVSAKGWCTSYTRKSG